MSAQNPTHLWKHTVFAHPRFQGAGNRMHLAVLHQAVAHQEGGLLSLRFSMQDFVLYELKGRPAELIKVDLPGRDSEILWLCAQFSGMLSFPMGSVSQTGSIFSFSSPKEGLSLTVPVEKVWVLLLGIKGGSRQQLLSEYPALRQHQDHVMGGLGMARPLGYMDRQHLEQFGRKTFGPFSTLHHIGALINSLYGTYTKQLDVEPSEEVSMLLLHSKAIAYVRAHFMEADLNRHTIAAALNCATRTLNRAFEGRTRGLNETIILMRLHKARELLRTQPELTVDQIAGMIHFPNTKYFATLYKKVFRRSPREERKDISNWT